MSTLSFPRGAAAALTPSQAARIHQDATFAERIRHGAVLEERDLQRTRALPESLDKWRRLWALDAELRTEFSCCDAYLAAMWLEHPEVVREGRPAAALPRLAEGSPAQGAPAGKAEDSAARIVPPLASAATFDHLTVSPTGAPDRLALDRQWDSDPALREEFTCREAFLSAMVAPCRPGC